ncbi:MAG: ATP-dependent helicase [Acidimicrobiales bacterium]
MDAEALLEGLDPAQAAAVTSTALPLVILAPAGSGKTRVLTRRIAHRVATGGIDPRHVLALTFTRKAAGELDERLRRLGLRGDASTGTFHAVAWGLLRTRWSDQGRTPLTLLDRKGRLLAEVARSAPGRDKRQTTADLATEIEWAKARMVTPDAYAEAVAAAGRKPALRPELVAEGYAAYERRKQRGGLVDFDDLLALCARAIEDDDRFAAAQRWRFRHLFVDELQDVNPLQFRLLEAWRGDRYDVTAVGDPQQAIYGWNGADAGFLLDIHRHWPPAEVVELDRSYRSTPEILGAAAAVLRSARQPAREVQATRPSGVAVRLHEHADDRAEAMAIAGALRLAHLPGRPWADQAVLVRTHAQTHLITEALRGAGIPHRVRGGATFLDRPEVRRTLRELRSATVPLGTALADLELQLEAMEQEPDGPAVDDDATGDPGRLERLTDEREALAALLRMGRDYLRLDPTGRAGTFSTWLVATVQSEGDAVSGRADAVEVATFHAAKGLEWAVVHLAGVEEGYVPISHARTAAAKAEEARLLYVAMTRAQRELHITWAAQRTFATRVASRRRSPLLDPLMTDERFVARAADDRDPSERASESSAQEGWAEDLARQRAALRHTGHHDGALVGLRRWRDATARAARIDPAAVLPDHVLSRVAAAAPADLDELRAVRGVGSILAGRFGAAMLEAMADTGPAADVVGDTA